MKEQFQRLIKVKSLVTLILTGAFCGLAFAGVIGGNEFMTIYTTVMAFYFGTQAAEKDRTDGKEEGDGR